MFKVLSCKNPQIVNEMFCIKDEAFSELRRRFCFHIPSVNTVFRGVESMQFLGLKILELIPNVNKCFENIRDFKNSKKEMKTNVMSMQNLHVVGFLHQMSFTLVF